MTEDWNNVNGAGHKEEVFDALDDDTGEIIYFRLNEMNAATSNFSVANKLGEGGFGPVYWVITRSISIYDALISVFS